MELFELFGRIVVETSDAIEAMEETAEQAEETGESIGSVGEESESSSETTNSSWQSVIGVFTKAVAVAGTVVTAVIAIGKAMIQIAEETREYRKEMGKLESAFQSGGHSAETAKATYMELQSVLGDSGQAVEASNHLAQLCSSENELARMTEACIGVYSVFGDSLPVEGLAEAANETAKTGSVTGNLADALNWAGQSEDEFNAKLATCNGERERAALITETLIELYGESGSFYKQQNKDIISSTTAQEKLNAAIARWGAVFEPIAAAWYEFLASLVNIAADGFEIACDATAGLASEMVGVAESTQEAEAKVKDLEEQLALLNEKDMMHWTDYDHQQYQILMQALSDARAQYDSLVEAEKEAARQAEAAADASIVEEFNTATEQYVANATQLYKTFVDTYTGIFDQVSNWFKPFEEASVSVTTSVGEMMKAMQSQVEFNERYNANLQALKDYGLGGLSEAFQSYGAAGAAYADTIVKAVEEAGGATTEEGQAIINGFADMNKQVEESQSELSQTVTLMNGELEAELQALQDNYGAAIEGLDMSAEAAQAARSTFQGFLDSMNKEIPGIVDAVSGFGSKITNAIKSGIGTISIPFELVSYSEIPGFKEGLEYVPYDNYLAYLHKGEAVLTAEEAKAWRAGKGFGDSGNAEGTGGGVTIVQNIEAVAQTPVELASATAAYFEQARWAT